MAATLRYLGLFLLAAAACLLVAEQLGWLEAEMADDWIRLASLAGTASFGAGILLGVLAPVGRALRQGRCVRCGAPTQKGQTYCLDHLQATINEYRDQTREGVLRRTGGR